MHKVILYNSFGFFDETDAIQLARVNIDSIVAYTDFIISQIPNFKYFEKLLIDDDAKFILHFMKKYYTSRFQLLVEKYNTMNQRSIYMASGHRLKDYRLMRMLSMYGVALACCHPFHSDMQDVKFVKRTLECILTLPNFIEDGIQKIDNDDIMVQYIVPILNAKIVNGTPSTFCELLLRCIAQGNMIKSLNVLIDNIGIDTATALCNKLIFETPFMGCCTPVYATNYIDIAKHFYTEEAYESLLILVLRYFTYNMALFNKKAKLGRVVGAGGLQKHYSKNASIVINHIHGKLKRGVCVIVPVDVKECGMTLRHAVDGGILDGFRIKEM